MIPPKFEDIEPNLPVFEDIGKPEIDVATLKDEQFAEDVRDMASRVRSAWYYSRNLGLPVRDAYDLEPEISGALYGEGTSSDAAWKETRKFILGARRKTLGAAVEHGTLNALMRAKSSLAGLGRMAAEIKGIEASVVDPALRWMLHLPKDIDLDEELVRISKAVSEEIRQSQQEHPELGFALDPDAGYSETLWQMVSRPENLVQGLVETSPLVLEGLLAGKLAGLVRGAKAVKAGRIIGMAIPLSGDVYRQAREENTPPIQAFAQAVLTGGLEATIEEWTLGRKVSLGKTFRRTVTEGGVPKVMWEGIKAFFRGSAEEGSQRWNENLWRWLFTDRSQKWFEGVEQATAIGGPLELAMSGGFAGAGAIGKPVDVREARRRLQVFRRTVRKSPELTAQEKDEILTELDKAEGLVPDILLSTAEQERRQAVGEKPVEARVPEAQQPWEVIASERENTPEAEKAAIDAFIAQVPDAAQAANEGTVPAQEPYLDTRDEAFAQAVEQIREEPDEVIDGGPSSLEDIEDARDAIRIGRRLGYRDADILAYLKKNYAYAASTLAQAEEAPAEQPEEEAEADKAYKKMRRVELTKTTKAIKAHPQYQVEAEAREQQAFSATGLGTVYFSPRMKGDLEAYIGEKGKRGSNKAVWSMITFDPKKGQHWDDAGQELGWGEDFDTFMQRFIMYVEGGIEPDLLDVAQGSNDPVLETLAIKRAMLLNDEPVATINAEIEANLMDNREFYGMSEDEALALSRELKIGGEGGPEISVGAAALNWQSRRRAVDKAQKQSRKTGEKRYVVQRSDGSFMVKKSPPKKGHYTVVDMKRPLLEQVTFIKQASPTVEEAFDYGEHPKERMTALSELQRFKKELKQKNANLVSIKDEIYQTIKRLPKDEQARLYSILQKVSPKSREKTNLKNLAAAIARAEAILRLRDKVQAIAELQNTWADIKSNYRRGQAALGKLDQYTRERIQAIMKYVDIKALSERKRRDIESLGRYVNRLAQGVAEAMSEYNASQEAFDKIPERRLAELNRLGQTPIQQMDAKEIRLITDSLTHVVHEFELKNKIVRRRGYGDFLELRDRAINEVYPERTQDYDVVDATRPRRRGFVKTLLDTESAHLDTLVEEMTHNDAAETMDLLVNALHEGQRQRTSKLREAVDYIRAELDEAGITYQDVKGLDETVTITLAGTKVDVTRDVALSFYLHSKSEDNMRRLLKTKAFVIGDQRISNRDAHGDPLLTLEEIGDIVDALTGREKAFGDIWGRVNAEVLAPAVNEVSKQLLGHELAVDPHYYAIHRVLPKRIAGKGTAPEASIEDHSRFQARVGGTDAIRITPFRQEFMSGIQNEVTYYGLSLPMRNARALLHSPEWQLAVEQAGHADRFKAARTILARSQTYATSQSIIDMQAQRLLNKFSRSTLGLRISTVGAQVASAPAAMSEVPAEYFVGATVTRGRIAKITRLSSLLWDRWSGKKINIEVGNLAAQHTLDTLLFDKMPWAEIPMKALIAGDKTAIGLIHAAIENETEALHPTLEPGTAAFDEFVINRLEYVTRRTQPMWAMLDRSVLSSDPSAFKRALLMFRSAREMQLNVLLRAYHRYAKSDKTAQDTKKLANDVAAVTACNLAIAVWKKTYRAAIAAGATGLLVALGLIDKPEPDEEERKTMADVALDVAKDTGENVMSLLPFGDVAGQLMDDMLTPDSTVAWSEPYDNPFAGLLKNVWKASIDVKNATLHAMNGEEYKSGPRRGQYKWPRELGRALEQTAQAAAKVLGIPFSAPMQEFVRPVQKALKESPQERKPGELR